MEKQRLSSDLERSDVTATATGPVLPVVNPDTEKSMAAGPGTVRKGIHPGFYIATWIAVSGSVIIFNKWILDAKKFHFPIALTAWHMGFAAFMTQIMARFTSLLDSRKNVPMSGRVYLRKIVPIGVAFSISLICGNLTYLYLSVSFIQMLKATTPVFVLLTSWVLHVAEPNLKTLANVSCIVLGVIIASVGEIQFVFIGFIFQIAGLIFEAIRLTMVQQLLSGSDFKMDPLVSLYYFAPACAFMNGVVALILEVPNMSLVDFERVGYFNLLANALVAFGLNVSVVFLIGKTSSLVMTLSGVLKDILLVAASMLIFRDPVTGLQFFGYSIALGGLVYYKLGGDKIREYAAEGSRQWAEYGNRSPILRKLLTFALVAGTIVFLLGGIGNVFQSTIGSSVRALSAAVSGTGR